MPPPSASDLLIPLAELPEGLPVARPSRRGELIVLRTAEGVLAYENRCPHRGTSLDWVPGRFLSADGQFLQCATHGALFRFEDGQCVAGPCAGDALTPCAVFVLGDAVYLDSK